MSSEHAKRREEERVSNSFVSTESVRKGTERTTSSSSSSEQIFKCSRCDFSVKYDYFGRSPPFCRSLGTLEEVYIMRDPFTDDKRVIVLGSHCTACNDIVCSSQECSLYYMRRFCLQCVGTNQNEFPSQIVLEVKKRQQTSTVHWTEHLCEIINKILLSHRTCLISSYLSYLIALVLSRHTCLTSSHLSYLVALVFSHHTCLI